MSDPKKSSRLNDLVNTLLVLPDVELDVGRNDPNVQVDPIPISSCDGPRQEHGEGHQDSQIDSAHSQSIPVRQHRQVGYSSPPLKPLARGVGR